jgi:hypothetical protein
MGATHLPSPGDRIARPNVGPSPGDRAESLEVVRRVVLVCCLLAGVLGGMAVWRAVDRLDEAWARHAVVRGEMADVEGIIDARLDAAVGVVGLDSGFPTGDDDLEAQLDDLFEWAEVQPDGLRDDVTSRERELTEVAEANGAVDERRLVRLESALRELDRQVVRPTADAAQAAHQTARRTVLVVAASLAGLLGAAAWLGRRQRAVRA